MTWLLVALGGSAGAVLRDLATRRRGGVPGTDLVNRVGAVLLGVVVAGVDGGVLGDGVLGLLGVGLAGGMTTFSTWIVQVVDADPSPDWTRLVRETVFGLALAAAALWLATPLFGS